MSTEDRRDRLRALSAEAAEAAEASRSAGARDDGTGRGAPFAGALYVLPATADFPVEWLLLEPLDPLEGEAAERWLAVPADTNPLRGPGDVWIGPDAPAGPLILRCRFAVPLPVSALAAGRPTGRVDADAVARALATVRDHERGALDPGPLAEEVAEDPEYQDWEAGVLAPAVETVTGPASMEPEPGPEPEPELGPKLGPKPAGDLRRGTGRAWTAPWIALAATLALLSLGLGAWNLALRRQVARLSGPVLIGGSQEVVVGDGPRGPVTLRVRPAERHLLVFVVLEGTAAGHERYRVELADDAGATVWRSPVVTPGAIDELNLVIPRRLLEGPHKATTLRVYATEGDRAQRLAEVPLRVAPTEEPR